MNIKSSLILALSLVISSSVFALLLSDTAIAYKNLERSVVVKGLSVKEVKADTAIWPIIYSNVGNDITKLYKAIEVDRLQIVDFLHTYGFEEAEVSISAPQVVDKWANSYGNNNGIRFRYSSSTTISIYTKKVDKVRACESAIAALGKKGIVFKNSNYEGRIEYLFSGLNRVKPQMIEESTKNARASALKFAEDSDSELGKIKKARQGQFSITSRDSNSPYIKRLRVVSSVEYYLSD